ncbi:hypothetical protein B0T13DRAFT_485413 [Neurospora crassa]|nr:hypothetical protein B0T13DRAFT_485413 [Neurospora crassa]
MCQLSYVLSPFTHAHHSLARDQRRSQCCHLVCITYCCAAAARQSESPESPDPGSPSRASSSSFSSLINYDDNYDDDTTTTTNTTTNSNSNTNTNTDTPPLSPPSRGETPREETPREETPPESSIICITFNRTTTPTFIIHHVRQAHQCPHYTNVCIERPRDWFYYGSMLAFAVERLPRTREGYTLSWRWVWERMPLASREDGDGGTSGEREMDMKGREGRESGKAVRRKEERKVQARHG